MGMGSFAMIIRTIPAPLAQTAGTGLGAAVVSFVALATGVHRAASCSSSPSAWRAILARWFDRHNAESIEQNAFYRSSCANRSRCCCRSILSSPYALKEAVLEDNVQSLTSSLNFRSSTLGIYTKKLR